MGGVHRTVPEAALATKVVVEEGFAPLLIGEDALDVERLWQAMRDRSWWYGNGGIASFASAPWIWPCGT